MVRYGDFKTEEKTSQVFHKRGQPWIMKAFHHRHKLKIQTSIMVKIP